jgi:ankyrin repeat protein
VQLVAALLRAGVLMAADSNGRCPIHLAAGNGHIQCVAELLAAGADVNSCDESGMAPLHWVANRGGVALAEVLINAGADVNKRNKDGWSPLHWAARAGRSDVSQMLLAAGADACACNHLGRTPAQMTDKEAIRQLLREHSGDAAMGGSLSRPSSPLPARMADAYSTGADSNGVGVSGRESAYLGNTDRA